MLRRFIKHNMGFSQTEANGFLILVPLILFIVFSPLLYERFFAKKYNTYETDRMLLDSLNRQIEQAFLLPQEEIQAENFLFNPNRISKDSMIRLGIPEFLAQRILNYRSKGGYFYETSDLSHIYDFPDSLYQRLSVWVVLDKPNLVERQRPHTDLQNKRAKATVVLKEPKEVAFDVPVLVDINAADTVSLQNIYGIGSIYARRIVAYRELLGGYVHIDQLREVYGLTDTLFQKIEAFVTLSDTVRIATIPINLADFKTLVAHPYISYEMTKSIMSAKSQYGKFRNLEDLFRLEDVDSSLVFKLAPYLSF